MDLVCTWLTGRDAGGTLHLTPGHPAPGHPGPGRYVVGRAPTADIRCDDPTLQAHHALVEVAADGTVRLTQLTGRSPVMVAGRPVDGTVEVPLGTWVEVGASVLTFERAPEADPAATLHGNTLVRSPRSVPELTPLELVPPIAPKLDHESPGGLVPALLGLAGSATIAVLLHQPMFLLFGALGGLVAVGSWVTQWLAQRRRRRRDADGHRAATAAHQAATLDELERFRHHRHQCTPGLVQTLRTARDLTANMWSRRKGHPDAHLVTIGLGDLAWQPHVVADLPVPVDLGPGRRIALGGPQAHSVALSLVIQLTVACGPADVRVVVVTRQQRRWECLRGLPHLTLPDGTSAIADEASLTPMLADLEQAEHVLLVTDEPALLTSLTSPLRRALGEGHRALLTVLGEGDGVPHLCTGVLTTTGGPGARWVADTRVTMLPVPVRMAGLGERAAALVTMALSPLTDPEDPLAAEVGLPHQLSLVDLLGRATCTPAGIAAGWAAAESGQGTGPGARTFIGAATDGLVEIDLVRDGPHGLIAGTTGAGKSELLRSLVVGMAVGASPAHLAFVLVDYKGGATFDACALLPHVVGVVTDLDDHLADRALRSLQAELRRREAVLRHHGVADLAALREVAPAELMPRLVVVIDEFAALVAEQPVFLHSLVGVAQRGRSLGVHLLLATQRPHGVISDDIRANTNLRVALRLHDPADAVDVVGNRSPALLPRGVPGRAVMRLGPDEYVNFQTAGCTGAGAGPSPGTELSELVRVIGEAARLCSTPTPKAPWLAPLPARLEPGEVPIDAVGLVDDPDHQAVVPLTWAPGDGSIVVAGSPGCGVSSTLHTLAASALRGAGTEVYVLDGHSGTTFDDLAAHPRVQVVGLHERVRLVRLLHRLRAGQGPGAGGPARVLVIDGLDQVRRTLDDLETADEYEALAAVLTLPAGLTVVAGVENVAGVPASFLTLCRHRWVLHINDPHDAALLGVPAAAVPARVAGRLRVAASGLLAQLVIPGGRPVPTESRAPDDHIAPIRGLPLVLAPESLPHSFAADGFTVLPLGLDIVGGEPAVISVPDGDHVLVLGPSRCGRSSTLGLLTAAWRAAHPDGWVGVIMPRRSTFDAGLADHVHADTALLDSIPPHGDCLVVVDDAELVDDPGGRLAAIAAGAESRVTTIAAGRPDALRLGFGHWTSVVRRSRLGVVHTGGSDLDGDLLGAVLPRRIPVRPRAGLAWVVADGDVRLVQLALLSTAEPAMC